MEGIKINYALKSEVDKTKPSLLYIMFTVKGFRKKISLGYSIIPEYWEQKKKRIIISTKQTQSQQRKMKQINRFLTKLESEIENVNIDEYDTLNDIFPNADEVISKSIASKVKHIIKKLKYGEKEEEQQRFISVLEFCNKVINNMDKKIIKRTGRYINSKTIGHHKIVLKRLTKYLEAYNQTKARFDIFDKYFESKFENWLLSQEYTPNTIVATFSVMKVWIKQAEEEGLITDKNFHNWKTKGYDVEHIYLTEEELKRIYELDLSETKRLHPNTVVEEVRDLFIVASQIGLRYGDLNSLNSSNWDLQNKIVQVHTHKTGETVKVPLSTMAIEIYKKYNGKFPKAQDKGKFNASLKKIGKQAGINTPLFLKSNKGGKMEVKEYKKYELISSHTARRSFATNLYKRSKDSRMVMNFTGHKTEESFRKYICIDKLEMIEIARQYFD